MTFRGHRLCFRPSTERAVRPIPVRASTAVTAGCEVIECVDEDWFDITENGREKFQIREGFLFGCVVLSEVGKRRSSYKTAMRICEDEGT